MEHRVHFFDLYDYWFGKTKVLWAHAQRRPITYQIDRVTCYLHHETGVLSNHYHGFDQSYYLDRQIRRILFETGDISVYGWIPLSISISGITDDESIKLLKSICPEGEFISTKAIHTTTRSMKGRGKAINPKKQIIFQFSSPLSKQKQYTEAVRNLLKDQISYIRNPNHQRVITEENGFKAVEPALKASNITMIY